MSEYTANILWKRNSQEVFIDHKYSREHQWNFDGGASISATSSPSIVPLPYSVETNVDPEEAFIASLSSCHMLFFLAIAAKRGFVIDSYDDNALGHMAKNQQGKIAMNQVILRPKVIFSGDKKPDTNQLETMHHQAHQQCFIANSVITEVITEIQT